MNRIDLIRFALKNFTRRKTRSILTILGVIIGTASIVVMLSLGIGMNESFKQQLSRMGSLNVINVDTYYFPENGNGQVKETVLDDKAVAKINAIDGVEAVMPLMDASLKLVSGKYSTYANIQGVDPDVLEAFDFKVSEGRLLNSEDTTSLLFGGQTPYNFYNPRDTGGKYGRVMIFGGRGGDGEMPEPDVDVLNDKMVMTFDMSYGERRSVLGGEQQTPKRQPKLYKVKGIGILEDSQDEKSYTIYMNMEYLKKLIKENEKAQNQSTDEVRYSSRSQNSEGYRQAKVKVKDIKDVQRIQKQINELGYGANSLGDILEGMKKTSATMQAVLGGIGAISLFVAAIGITNTMVMSIYERTREIGVMKVLGCLLSDIKNMFLFEAGVIGFIGGIAGLALSYTASFVLNRFSGIFSNMGMYGGETISIIPMWLALASLGFATLVGLISGFMPARRAMKLSALEAIRTE